MPLHKKLNKIIRNAIDYVSNRTYNHDCDTVTLSTCWHASHDFRSCEAREHGF